MATSARLRLHHRRRRLGRLRARQPAQRRPGAAASSWSRPGGDARHFWLRLPVGYFRSIYDPRFSWQFPLEPEAGDRRRAQVAWPRGKALGGSSVINGLLYIRGQHADFDDWAAVNGARGWSYREVLPFFKRSEAYEGGASEWHGASGELGVSDLRNDHPYCEAWLAAGAEAGYPLTADFNGAQLRRPRPLPAHAARPLALRRGDGVPRAGARAAEPDGRRPARR